MSDLSRLYVDSATHPEVTFKVGRATVIACLSSSRGVVNVGSACVDIRSSSKTDVVVC